MTMVPAPSWKSSDGFDGPAAPAAHASWSWRSLVSAGWHMSESDHG